MMLSHTKQLAVLKKVKHMFTLCYRLNCIPTLPTLKSDIEVLVSGTCECGLIWEQGLCRCNQVEMRSLAWASIQYECCPYKRETWTQVHTAQNAIQQDTDTEDRGPREGRGR